MSWSVEEPLINCISYKWNLLLIKPRDHGVSDIIDAIYHISLPIHSHCLMAKKQNFPCVAAQCVWYLQTWLSMLYECLVRVQLITRHWYEGSNFYYEALFVICGFYEILESDACCRHWSWPNRVYNKIYIFVAFNLRNKKLRVLTSTNKMLIPQEPVSQMRTYEVSHSRS